MPRLTREHALLLACTVIAVVTACGSPTTPSSVGEGATKTIITVGDIAQCDNLPADQSTAAKTANLTNTLLMQANADAPVLTLGDNVYYAGLQTEFDTCYQPTWGKLKARTWATPGNHDYGVANAAGYFDYFGAAAGTDRSGFYSKEYNGWLVLSLNSNVDAARGSVQYNWLQTQLQKNTNSCVLAAWHHPLFTSSTRGGDPKMKDMFELLVNARADLVLQGHEHQYERFVPMLADGTVSGAKLYDFAPAAVAGSTIRIAQFGVLKLDLRPGQGDWQFIGLDQKALDAGQLTCKLKT
jgi:acid phosphatase type 7